MFKGHTHCVRAVAISADGSTIVSGSLDKTVRVWSLGTGQVLACLRLMIVALAPAVELQFSICNNCAMCLPICFHFCVAACFRSSSVCMADRLATLLRRWALLWGRRCCLRRPGTMRVWWSSLVQRSPLWLGSLSHWLQLLYELTASRVFTLKGAEGVESIVCDQGVRPLLDQRSRSQQKDVTR